MIALIIGLLLFFSAHASRIFADANRTQYIAHYGMAKWKLAYSLVSIIGLVLVVWGYGQARLDPIVLWVPPIWTRHLAALLTLPAFILIAAAYIPGTLIKARIGHPMVAGVKLWALSHLIANGNLADVILFGTFLAWSIASFTTSRKRDRTQGTTAPRGAVARDAVAIGAGLVGWFVFVRYLHLALFGVAPFG